MLIFRKTDKIIDVLKDKEWLGSIFFSKNYKKYYFNPSGIAVSETQIVQILNEIKKLNSSKGWNVKINFNVCDNQTQISDDDSTVQIQIGSRALKIGCLIVISLALIIGYFILK